MDAHPNRHRARGRDAPHARGSRARRRRRRAAAAPARRRAAGRRIAEGAAHAARRRAHRAHADHGRAAPRATPRLHVHRTCTDASCSRAASALYSRALLLTSSRASPARGRHTAHESARALAHRARRAAHAAQQSGDMVRAVASFSRLLPAAHRLLEVRDQLGDLLRVRLGHWA